MTTHHLDLSNRNLTTLTERNLENFTNLTSLSLGRNNLTIIPESIGNLHNLTSLSLGFNKLKTLPESIGNLANLMSEGFILLPNPYTGMYAGILDEYILKNILKESYIFFLKINENIKIECVILLDFNKDTFRIKTKSGMKNMIEFLNIDSNNYVIIKKSDISGKLYDGFGFNKKDKRQFIIECRNSPPIFSNLLSDSIYDVNTDCCVLTNYMNSLYKSTFNIFFVDNKVVINHFVSFNNIQNINLETDTCVRIVKNVYNLLYRAHVEPIYNYNPRR